jgi:predicted ester cyclase
MSDTNGDIARQLFEEVWNNGNLKVLDSLVAPDVVLHVPPKDLPPGREGYRQYVAMFREAFPDIHFELQYTIGGPNRVVAQVTARGTHQGDLMGLTPTGDQVTVTGLSTLHIVDGQVVEVWDEFDFLERLREGPPPEDRIAETPVQGEAPATGMLGAGYYYGGQAVTVDINTVVPTYTVVRSVSLPAGNYMIIAGLHLHLSDGLEPGNDPGEFNLSPAGVVCKLSDPVYDLDMVSVIPGAITHTFASLSNHHTEVTLRGAVSFGEEGGTIKLRCAQFNDIAEAKARSLALVAFEVGDIAYDFSGA